MTVTLLGTEYKDCRTDFSTRSKLRLLSAFIVTGCLAFAVPSDAGLLDRIGKVTSSLTNSPPSKNSLATTPALSQINVEPIETKPLLAIAPLNDLLQNKPLDLQTLFKKNVKGRDKVLFLLERGRMAQLLGDTELSKTAFGEAIQAIKDFDEQALVTAKDAGSQLAAILLNDNAIAYNGDGFERVLLRHFQALNYLASGDLEGAAVEIRNANFEQEQALKAHEKEVAAAEHAAEENRVTVFDGDVSSGFSIMDEAAGKVKNSFQNAYTFYMSAILREMLGEPNDAYIDYKKALEIFPDNTFIQQDVVRLANELQMIDDIQSFPTSLATLSSNLATRGQNDGEIIVFFEDGLVPKKEGILISIPLASGLTGVAFPIYNTKWTAPEPLVITSDGTKVSQSQPVCYIGSLAVQALKERIPTMLLRQVLRSTVKGVATKAAKDRAGGWGSLAASAYNLLSEKPDTRSWISLPAHAQIIRMTLSTGTHSLALRQSGSAAMADTSVLVLPGQKTILRAIRIGDRLVTQTLWTPSVAAPQTAVARMLDATPALESMPTPDPVPDSAPAPASTAQPSPVGIPAAAPVAPMGGAVPLSKRIIIVTKTPGPAGPRFSITWKDTGRVMAESITDAELKEMFPGAWVRFHRPPRAQHGSTPSKSDQGG
jgi:uncharacterized protein